ncbi:MAG: hypothetical protein QXP04_03735 [Candidatus Nanoarchaeia archaeon]|nr:hypothetical protein [Candidatus Jingweiarchaeum tengchongense]
MSVVFFVERTKLHDMLLQTFQKRGINAFYVNPYNFLRAPPAYWNYERVFEQVYIEGISEIVRKYNPSFIVSNNWSHYPMIIRIPTLYMLHIICFPIVEERIKKIRERINFEGYRLYDYSKMMHYAFKVFSDKNIFLHCPAEEILQLLKKEYPRIETVLIRYPVWENTPPVPRKFEERDFDILIISKYHKILPMIDIVVEAIEGLRKRGLKVVYKHYTTSAFRYRNEVENEKYEKYLEILRNAGAEIVSVDMKKEEYYEFISRFKVAISFSVDETFGVKIAEQMALTPTLTITNDFWFKSIIKCEPENLVDEVIELISSKGKWSETLEEQREESSQYTPEKTFSDMNSLLDRLFERGFFEKRGVERWM